MAQFCIRCGRPLPENGICSCQQQAPSAAPQYQQPQYQQPQYQQPQYQQPYNPAAQNPQQGYAPQQMGYAPQPQQAPKPKKPASDASFGAAFADLFPFLGRSMKDPAGEIRKKAEKKNFMFGIVLAILFASAVLLSSITSSLGIWGFHWFGNALVGGLLRWLATVALAVGASLGANLLSTLASGQKVDFLKILTGTLCALLIPTAITVVAILPNLLGGVMVSAFSVLAVFTMLVSNYMVSTKVLNANSLWTILIHCGLAMFVNVILSYVPYAL